MGRYVRAMLRAFDREPGIDLTLLVDREADRAAIRAAGTAHAIAPSAEARRRGRFDVAWFPFNGMRIAPNVPAVVTIHDPFAFTFPAGNAIARAKEQRPILRAVRYATRIVTDSAWSKAALASELALDGRRIEVVQPDVEPFWSPSPAAVRGASVVAVAGPERRKNLVTLIDACARARLRPPEELVIVGSIDEALRARIRATGLACRIVTLDDEDLRELYRTAAIVAVPSLAEGYGLVAAEAIACGAPVLAARASALPEVGGAAPRYVDALDVEGWAQNLRELLDDAAARGALAAASRARAGERRAGEGAAALLAILREAAGLSPRAASAVDDRP